jgi:hypothetical protein
VNEEAPYTRERGTLNMSDVNVLALFKGEEKFIFLYDDNSRDELISAFRDAAADPTVSLSWFDAAVLTERAKQQAEASNALDDNT